MSATNRTARVVRAVLLWGAASLPLSPVWAQASTGPASTPARLEEVVITSQKRATALANQDVGASISAFDTSAMDKAFAVTLTDLGRIAPNVQLNQVSTFNGYANFYIRGIGINGSTRTVDPAVGLFVDGIYVGFGPSSIVDTFDLGSVEVLRGPQGTLFGRNVTGGAVVATTKRPTDEFELEGRITLGNYDRADAALVVNVPFTETVAGRLATLVQHQQGYFTNLENGRHKADKNLLLVRPSIKVTPSDTFDFTLIGEFLRNNGGPSNSQNIVSPTANNAATNVFGYVPPKDKYSIRHNLQGYSNTETKQLIGEANWDLGHGLVTAIAGWRDTEFLSSTDFDGSPITLFHFKDNVEEQDQKSVELRYASSFSDKFAFTFGLYYFTQDFYVGEQRETFGGVVLGTVRTAGVTRETDENYAAFLQGTYQFTDRWALTLGGRYTEDNKEILFSPPGRCTLDYATCTLVLPGEDTWSNFSPKVGVEFKLSPDVLTYASWTKGFRSGVFNARAQRVEFLGPSEPETVASTEIGLKSELFDRRVRFNVAVFQSKYDDIQKILNESFDPDGPGPQPATSGQTVQNAAKATIEGVEVEVNTLVTERFTIDASVGYTDAAYDSFPGLDLTGDGVPDPALAKQTKFEKVPEWTGYLGAEYTIPVDVGDLRLRASYAYTSRFFTDQFNRRHLSQEPYGLVDASMTLNAGDHWEVSLWGKNLTDEEYIDFAADVGTLGSWVFGGEPRRYGVEVRYKH